MLSVLHGVILGWAVAALIFSGVSVYVTARLARALRRRQDPARWPSIALLRPCEGAEQGLHENLASSLAAYGGARRVVLLVPSERDPSCAVARAVAAAAPAGSIEVVVTHAASRKNRKSAHLAVGLSHVLAPPGGQGAATAAPEVIVQADSDVRLDDEALPALVAALLERDGVAAAFAVPIEPDGVTFADRCASALLSASQQDFLALRALSYLSGGVVVLAGALAAHRTDELVATGGFASLEDLLGEDYEVSRRLRARGREVEVSARAALCAIEGRGFREIAVRTARWQMVARRQRGLLLFASYPFLLAATPLLLLASLGLLAFGQPLPLLVTSLAWAARAMLASVLRAAHGVPVSPWRAVTLVLAGELLMLASFPRALFGDEVVWRGRRLRIAPGGRIEPCEEPVASPPA